MVIDTLSRKRINVTELYHTIQLRCIHVYILFAKEKLTLSALFYREAG